METKNPTASDNIEKSSQKSVGYKNFSTFLASNDDFCFLRRFNSLHARILLQLQDEIVQLEDELDCLEGRDSGHESHIGTIRGHLDVTEQKRAIVSKLRSLLVEYDELFLKHAELRQLPSVPKRYVKQIQNWLADRGNPIATEEVQYLEQFDDLAPLIPKPKSWFRLSVERGSGQHIPKPVRNSKTAADIEATITSHGDTYYTSNSLVDNLVNMIVIVIGSAMLIGPLWALNAVEGTTGRLALITGFIVVGVALLCFSTVAKPFQVLASTLAYAAMLMVFLQTN